MSNKKLGWAFSANRPVAVQSPSMTPLSDIQTRLSFSISSPSTQAKKRSLISINRKAPSSGPSTPLRGTNNRLADYHMSKQNPDVLDRMHSTTTSVPASPQNSFSSYGRQIIASPHGSNVGPSSTNSSPGLPFQKSMTHTPVQVSLLRQSLKANKGPSSSRSSLVQLATQRGPVRLNSGATVSPVVVRLSRGSEAPSPVMLNDKGVPGLVRSVSGQGNGASEQQQKQADPCDKDTVLTALRSKRKRWASSAIEETTSSMSLASGQPAAKRSRKTVQPTVEAQSPTGRKRPHEPVSMSQTLDTAKRSKIIKPIPKKANKISMPVIEYEPELEQSPTEPPPRYTETPAKSQPGGKTEASPQALKEKSPPVVPMKDDQEIVKKREDSLSKLKTVFPSAKSEKSTRRKVPVFCATGQKPHMPSPLSSTYSVTREDLLKDREAAAEKLDQFLSSEDHVDGPTSSVATSDTNTESIVSSAANSIVSNQQKSDAPQTVSSTKEALNVSAALTGKTVSFASPISSTMLSTVTTQSTVGVSSSLLSGLTLPKPAKQSVPIPATTENQALSAPTLKSTGGGLSLPTVPLPSNTPSLSQVAVTSSDQPSTSRPAAAVMSGGLKIGAGTTQSTALQLPTLNTSTVGGLQSSTEQVNTESKIQPTGLKLGIPNATVTNSGISFGLTQSTAGAPTLQTSLKPVAATNSLSGLVVSTSTGTMSQALKTTQQPSSQPSLNFGGQQQTVPSGGLSFGITPQTTASLSTQQPSGGLMFGATTNSSTSTQQPNTGGLKFGASTNSSTSTQQPNTGGLKFGASTNSSTSTQQPSGGLMFGNTPTTSTTTQQTGGLSFGVPAQGTQQSSSGLLFSNKASTAANTQPGGGLMFGNAPTSNSQQTTGGLSFGKSAATTSTPGLLFGNNATTSSQSGGGLSFGTNTSNGTNSNQQSGGLMFGNKTATTSSGFSFTAAAQPPQTSMFGAPKEPPKPSGLLFGATTAQPSSSSTTFSFTAGGASQTSMFSGGNNTQQSLAFGAGQSQQNTQGTNSIFGGGMNASAQKPLSSIFGGQNTTSQTQQSTNNGSSGFSFTTGASNPLQQKTSGQLNFGQTTQTGLNFGQSQSGNGSSTAFSFKPNTGMSMGQTANTGLSFGGGNSSNAPTNTGPGANIFKSPQPGLQPPAGNTGSFQFTPQQPNTPQQGFSFSVTTPNQPSFNFSATTPTPNPFVAGTPGDSASRSTSRARRRGRKK